MDVRSALECGARREHAKIDAMANS